MDRVFLAVDAASTALEKKRKVALGGGFLRAASSAATTSHHEDVSKALNRVEFVTALVTIAINRYVRSTTKLHIADVSEALKRLLEVDIQSRFSPTLLAEPNAFRRECVPGSGGSCPAFTSPSIPAKRRADCPAASPPRRH